MTKRILTLLLALLLPAAACAQEEWTSLHFDPTDRHGAVDCIFVLAYSHAESTATSTPCSWNGRRWTAAKGRFATRAICPWTSRPTSAISMSSGEKACTGR